MAKRGMDRDEAVVCGGASDASSGAAGGGSNSNSSSSTKRRKAGWWRAATASGHASKHRASKQASMHISTQAYLARALRFG